MNYRIAFVVSNNRCNYQDLFHSKVLIGFDPEESADNNLFNP